MPVIILTSPLLQSLQVSNEGITLMPMKVNVPEEKLERNENHSVLNVRTEYIENVLATMFYTFKIYCKLLNRP